MNEVNRDNIRRSDDNEPCDVCEADAEESVNIETPETMVRLCALCAERVGQTGEEIRQLP